MSFVTVTRNANMQQTAQVPHVGKLLKSGEAARRLGISQQYLRLLAVDGNVPCIEVAGIRLYNADDIETLRAAWQRERANKRTR